MKKGREGEQGILLLDLAISLPAIIFLMGTIAFVSVFTVREGYRIYAEAELRQEVQDVMMRITGDAAEAYKVRKVYMSRGVGIKIWKRPIRLETPSVSKEKDKRGDVLYFTHEVGSLTKICYGDPHQPITGNSSSKCGQDTPTSKVGEECPLHLTFLKTINIINNYVIY